VHHINRRSLSQREIDLAIEKIHAAQKPVIIAGGGVHYSFACKELTQFAHAFKIPVVETQAGKSAISWRQPMSVGGVGVTGTEAANQLVQEADLIFVVGSRLSDFTTSSKWRFGRAGAQLLHLNVSAFDGYKMGADLLQADAREGLNAIHQALLAKDFQTSQSYQAHVESLRSNWQQETDRLYQMKSPQGVMQTEVVGTVNEFMQPEDIIICAAGSLPGDLHRLWRSDLPGSYHVEYAFSCMGYEVAAGLGVKMANPKAEVYVIVGDGSYLMLHSELLTSIQEGYKINVVLLNNYGYQCIKNLQMSQGSRGFGNEFRYRSSSSKNLDGQYLEVDFPAYARSLGCNAYFAENTKQLRAILENARKETQSTFTEIKVLPGSMSEGYRAWWRVGVAAVSKEKKVKQAYQEMERHIKEASSY